MEVNYEEINTAFESFKNNTACIKFVSTDDLSESSKLSVIRDVGVITGDCSQPVVNEIDASLKNSGFVLLNHWSGANGIEKHYLHPDKVEALSECRADKIKVKFNGIADPIEMATYYSRDQILVSLMSRRSPDLGPIQSL